MLFSHLSGRDRTGQDRTGDTHSLVMRAAGSDQSRDQLSIVAWITMMMMNRMHVQIDAIMGQSYHFAARYSTLIAL